MPTLTYSTTDTVAFAPELITLNDMIVQMVDFSGARLQDAMARNWKRSVSEGVEALSYNKACEWKYYNSQYRIISDEEVELTGYYDHTGGSSERLFTVTSGSIPDWVEFAHAEYDGIYYEVGRKLSSSTIALSIHSNPGEDVGTVGVPVVFTFYRTSYPIPADFVRFISLVSGSGKQGFEYVSASDFDYLEKIIRGSGRPFYYTICGSQKFYGTQLLMISPKVSTSTVIDINYRRRARTMNVTGFDTSTEVGTITATAGQTTATTSITLASRCLGSVIRVRADTTTPEGREGQYPYAEQRVVVGISGTTITVDRAWDASYSAKAFIVSDPIDVAPHMLNALKAEIKRRVARSTPREARELMPLDADAYEELTRAMEADRAYHPEWRSPILVDRIHLQG